MHNFVNYEALNISLLYSFRVWFIITPGESVKPAFVTTISFFSAKEFSFILKAQAHIYQKTITTSSKKLYWFHVKLFHIFFPLRTLDSRYRTWLFIISFFIWGALGVACVRKACRAALDAICTNGARRMGRLITRDASARNPALQIAHRAALGSKLPAPLARPPARNLGRSGPLLINVRVRRAFLFFLPLAIHWTVDWMLRTQQLCGDVLGVLIMTISSRYRLKNSRHLEKESWRIIISSCRGRDSRLAPLKDVKRECNVAAPMLPNSPQLASPAALNIPH